MDPATLGLAAAGLVAKKGLEVPGETAGDGDGDRDGHDDEVGASAWALLGRVAERVRNWLGDRGDHDGLRALELVEAAPDSQRSVEALADRITRAAKADPDGATDLALLLDAVRARARPHVASFVDDVYAGARVGRILQVSGVFGELDERRA